MLKKRWTLKEPSERKAVLSLADSLKHIQYPCRPSNKTGGDKFLRS